jgi:hypothetical protein
MTAAKATWGPKYDTSPCDQGVMLEGTAANSVKYGEDGFAEGGDRGSSSFDNVNIVTRTFKEQCIYKAVGAHSHGMQGGNVGHNKVDGGDTSGNRAVVLSGQINGTLRLLGLCHAVLQQG